MQISKFSKICSNCENKQSYNSKSAWLHAIKNNTMCNPCANKIKCIAYKSEYTIGQQIKDFTILYGNEKNNKWFVRCKCGKEYWIAGCALNDENRRFSCASCAARGKKGISHYEVWFKKYGKEEADKREKMKREKIRDAMSGKNHRNYGIHLTEETKEKLRIAMLQRHTPGFNKNACLLFTEMEEELKWNGVHAMKGGEYKIIGYSLDYYEPTLNIVIEFDEKHHEQEKYKMSDITRQQKIMEKLNCKFYRIKEGQSWREVLQEYLKIAVKNSYT